MIYTSQVPQEPPAAILNYFFFAIKEVKQSEICTWVFHLRTEVDENFFFYATKDGWTSSRRHENRGGIGF